MTPAQAIHKFEHLRRFTRDGERAVHKPLLALLILGRTAGPPHGRHAQHYRAARPRVSGQMPSAQAAFQGHRHQSKYTIHGLQIW